MSAYIKLMAWWMGGAICMLIMIGTTYFGFFDVTTHGRETCRAANPGYDCTLGWVKGEAFK